jgi:5-methylthioribose kinase
MPGSSRAGDGVTTTEDGVARFDTYFLMKAADAAEYARTKLEGFGADLESTEIGDGNLNYIFRVVDRKSGRSVVIKQAGDTARISADFKIATDRNRIEYDLLKLEAELAPGLVPQVFKYDPVMFCCAMEDLSDHVIMRKALLDRVKLPLFADHVTTFMANTLLLTSDVVMDHKAKKRLQGGFINPDLCEITEDLVYTEPFNDLKKRNLVFGPNLGFVTRELYQDQALRLETAKLKFDFLTNTQCLIHGDLHTGSIFVRPDSTKVIDPEFAMYGPAGYDVGNVVANLVFAWANADTTIADPAARADFTGWLERILVEVVDLFQVKWRKLWAERVTEPVARYPGFAEWYLGTVMRDTSGVCGHELCRRTVGLAQVKDLTSIADPARRVRAERVCLSLAKRCIMERDQVRTGQDYLARLRAVAAQHPRP